MLTFVGDVFFLSVSGYKARWWWRAMGRSCQQGGLASSAQCSHNGQGVPEEESGESNMAKDDNGEPGEWRTWLSEQTHWTSVNSERHQVMFSVLSFPICSITKLPHQHETHHKFVFAFFSVSIWLFFVFLFSEQVSVFLFHIYSTTVSFTWTV